MMDYTELMWQAIEGALGAEKTATLRYTPLHRLTGASTLSDAVAMHAITRREKKAFFKSVKTAAAAAPQVERQQSMPQKIATAMKARAIEAHVEGEVAVKVAAVRREVDRDIFDSLMKVAKANILTDVSESPMARELGKKLLGGAAAGVGLGVPLYAAGSALSEQNAEEMRNKALQAAAGVGLIGLGTYGAGRGMDYLATERERDNQAARSVDMQRAMLANTLAANQAMKYSSAGPDGKTDLTEPSPVLEESKGEHWPSKTKEKNPGGETQMEQEAGKVAELMKTAYIDAFLEQVDQTEKVAALRELNRDYGVSLICDLEKRAAGVLSNLAKRTAAGAGGGAVLGGTAGYLSGSDPNMLGQGGTRGRNALIGALGGGLTGGAVGRYGLKGAVGKGADAAEKAKKVKDKGGAGDIVDEGMVNQQLSLF